MSQQPPEGNSKFWEFICGSSLARELGITGHTPDDLKRFDDAYFDFYFYLKCFLIRHIPPHTSVLEVGLGFGSVSQWLGNRQNAYVGIDISHGPVELARLRLSKNANATALIGDVMSLSFPNDAFSASISIGAMHHTGNFEWAIEEVVRVTQPGGVIVGMVYNLLSGRNFLLRPLQTSSHLIRNIILPSHVFGDPVLRSWSDRNADGAPPPSTEYFSRRALRKVLERYGAVKIHAENLDELPLFGRGKLLRRILLKLGLGRVFGLDLYFVLTLPKN